MDPAYAEWVHVAMYVGDGVVFHSVNGAGVTGTLFNAATRNRRIAIRRLDGHQETFKTQLSEHLLASLGSKYGDSALFNIGSRLLDRLIGTRTWPPPSTYKRWVTHDLGTPVVCSEFIDRVYFHLTGHTVHSSIPLPIDFAASPDFVDVSLKWYRVP